MKITTLALSAFGLAGLTAAQNGNDPLILNNRTGLDPAVYDTFSTSYTNALTVKSVVSVPFTPSPVRSNTFLPRPTTSIQCWRNGYPCGQNGGQRSQRFVADFIIPTPALDARVPPPEWFSTHHDVPLPGQTNEVSMGILPIPTWLGGTPIPQPTGEVSMGILPIPTSLGGEPRTYDAPLQAPTSEVIFSALPTTTFTPPAGKSSILTDWLRSPTSEGAAATSGTVDCNLHFCPTGTLSSTSTPPSTPLPTIPGPIGNSSVTPAPSTSSHFAMPPEPEETIIDTCTESATSGSVVPPVVTSLSAAAPPIPNGAHERLVYCDRQNCITIQPSDYSCFDVPSPTSAVTVPAELTHSAAATAPVAGEFYTVIIDGNRHYCSSSMATTHTITPTPYPYTEVPSSTSGFAVPPAPTHIGETRNAGVPIDWWRGPGQPVLPDAPEGINGPIQRHSSVESVFSVATNDACYRHYCRSTYTSGAPYPTTMLTTTKPEVPREPHTLRFLDASPHVTFTA